VHRIGGVPQRDANPAGAAAVLLVVGARGAVVELSTGTGLANVDAKLMA
jgi:hypothetical protein